MKKIISLSIVIGLLSSCKTTYVELPEGRKVTQKRYDRIMEKRMDKVMNSLTEEERNIFLNLRFVTVSDTTSK